MLYNMWQNVEKLKVYEEAEYINITILGGNKLLGYSWKFEPELQTALSCVFTILPISITKHIMLMGKSGPRSIKEMLLLLKGVFAFIKF